MRTSIFYVGAVWFFMIGVLTYLNYNTILTYIFFGLGIFILGIGVGGSMANEIWKKVNEAIDVIKKLNNL